MTALDVVFAAVALVAAASGLLAVTTRHVVHAALWLVVCLGSVAGCYLVLGAEFVALVLLVYVGAVVVLVLFALMLTRAPIGPNEEVSTSRAHRILAAVLGAASPLLLAVLLPVAGPAASGRDEQHRGREQAVRHVGLQPFEVLSLLLLVSLVAAFAVSRMLRSAEAGELTPTPRRPSVIHRPAPTRSRPSSPGSGTYGVLARRNAVLVLIGVELVLNAANVLLISLGAVGADTGRPGTS